MVEFEYNLGNVILLVTAEIEEGYPAKINCAPEDSYPGEDDRADITECVIKETGADFEYDRLFYRRPAILKNGFPVYDSIEELLQETAIEKWREG